MIGTGDMLELGLTQRVKSEVRSAGNLPEWFCNLWFNGMRIMQWKCEKNKAGNGASQQLSSWVLIERHTWPWIIPTDPFFFHLLIWLSQNSSLRCLAAWMKLICAFSIHNRMSSDSKQLGVGAVFTDLFKIHHNVSARLSEDVRTWNLYNDLWETASMLSHPLPIHYSSYVFYKQLEILKYSRWSTSPWSWPDKAVKVIEKSAWVTE